MTQITSNRDLLIAPKTKLCKHQPYRKGKRLRKESRTPVPLTSKKSSTARLPTMTKKCPKMSFAFMITFVNCWNTSRIPVLWPSLSRQKPDKVRVKHVLWWKAEETGAESSTKLIWLGFCMLLSLLEARLWICILARWKSSTQRSRKLPAENYESSFT